ncbi:MAG: flavin-containing monooxygenase, partial [Anaerolineales bacterium]
TPNWMTHLPGSEYQGKNPDGFMTRKEIVSFFSDYIKSFNPPIRYGIEVTAIKPHELGYLVETNQGNYVASNVVIAVGLFQKPSIPACAKHISPKINQIHSSEYHNPQSLPPGAVLVVGSAQSGSQIAEEINQDGRKVYLSVSSAGRFPRRYRGEDAATWMEKLGYFKRKVNELDSPKEKFAASAHSSGKNGGHTINLHQFYRDGITLLGHILSGEGTRLNIAQDLHENLAMADQFEQDFVDEIDQYIQENRLDNPPEELPHLLDGYDCPECHELDLEQAGITTIIWATGYKFDFSWIHIPAFDADGYPIQWRGVSDYDGLYFISLPFLYTGISGVIAGVGADAQYIASKIVSRSKKASKVQRCHQLM